MKRVFPFVFLWLLFGGFSVAAQEIRVMSYNIRYDSPTDGENRWEIRKEKVASLLTYFDAGFIGLQEVQDHQRTFLLNKLKGYESIGVGRDDGKTKGEYSCLFYKTDRFTLLKQGTFWLSPTPDSVSKGWDAECLRICSFGLFEEKKSGQRFWVFNTHFDHIGTQARLESARLILRKIREMNERNLPVALTGDFNSGPEDAPVQEITAVLRDARTLSPVVFGPADTWNGFQFQEKPKGCIDHIFVSHHGWKVERFATLTDSYELKYPSDHFPVLATLHLSESR